MSSFFNSALRNLGFKSTSRSNGQLHRRSRSSLRDVDLRLNIGDSDESSFLQWKDAMKMVARLPDGIPPEFRKQLWLALASRYMLRKDINFEDVAANCLSDMDDPDESELGTQIIKDLHRTGCSVFSGDVAEQNQSHLKHVLLAYARWNVNVGYCQGFNMLAAIILEVVDWVEKDALKIMIFLIEGVLPESYFANHLRGLSVDMAVFRDLLRMRLCSLSQHLDKLQANSQDGFSYEPPLTNVFTMQWFLTLFSNCLPKETVLRVWDLILLEGNEVLLRTALAIWDGLADRIMAVESADEFYCIMGVLTREILEFGLMDANALLKTICTLAPFPFPQLHELRDNYTYNIQPFTKSWSSGRRFHIFTGDGDDDENEEDFMAANWCMTNDFHSARHRGAGNAVTPSLAFTSIGPGAFGSSDGSNSNNLPLSFSNFNTERMTLDISALKKQYLKLRERQKQAHVILSGAFQNQFCPRPHNSLAVNHLLIGKQPLTRRRSSQGHLRFAEKNASTHRSHGSNKICAAGSTKESSIRVEAASFAPVSSTSSSRNTGSFEIKSEYRRSSNDNLSPPLSSPDSDSPDQENPTLSWEKKVSDAVAKPDVGSSVNSEFSDAVCVGSAPSKLCCDFLDDIPVQTNTQPEAPVVVNPFPTKRRIGSMKKTKVRNSASSP